MRADRLAGDAHATRRSKTEASPRSPVSESDPVSTAGIGGSKAVSKFHSNPFEPRPRDDAGRGRS